MNTTQTDKVALTILRDLSKTSEEVWAKYPEFSDVLQMHKKRTRKYERAIKKCERYA